MNVFSPECYSPLGVLRELFLTHKLDSPCSLALQTPLTELSDTSLSHYLGILCLTIALEISFFVFIFFFKRFSLKKTLIQGCLAAILCNVISHPFVYFIFPALGVKYHFSYLNVLISAEIFAPLLEALVFLQIWKHPPLRVWSMIITANLTSWWVGIYLTS